MGEEIDATGAVPFSARTVADREDGGGGQYHRGAARPTRRDPPSSHDVVDVASVLAMPLSAVPPSVQDALVALAEEGARLRDELDRAHHTQDYLALEADQSSIQGLLNRRAFLRDLTHLLESSERAELPGGLALFHVTGLDEVRRRCGIFGVDQALAGLGEMFRAGLRKTDLVGYLDHGDFAVAFAIAQPDWIAEKVSRLVAQITDAPFFWRDENYLLGVLVGTTPFVAGLTAEQALDGADNVLTR